MTFFTDTHCHIHEDEYADREGAYTRAIAAGIQRLICVGTDEKSSRAAVEFAASHDSTWASVGLHPHDATNGMAAVSELDGLLRADSQASPTLPASDLFGAKGHLVLSHSAGKAESSSGKVGEAPACDTRQIVAIGECGLDYFYDNSPRDQQIEMFHAQLELARTYQLPVIFHVRDSKTPALGSVWDDFWPILGQYEGLRGVLHSFTDNLSNMQRAVSQGLLIGVNGISTFARDKSDMYAAIPLDRIVFETDAPFLTPVPHRGNVNEPAFITFIAQSYANLRSISLEELSRASERNATQLFFSNK